MSVLTDSETPDVRLAAVAFAMMIAIIIIGLLFGMQH